MIYETDTRRIELLDTSEIIPVLAERAARKAEAAEAAKISTRIKKFFINMFKKRGK